MATFLHMIG